MSHGAEPITFSVDGLDYAGLVWGDAKQPTVLALHGWLDNALSFWRLGPLLKHHRVIALDLSGHGLSSHRSADATYNIWDDIPQLTSIAETLGTPLSLIGHSRGATIATQLAVVLGEQCERLVLIDGLLPGFNDDRNAAQQLINFVRERQKYAGRGERLFASIDEFVARRAQYGFSDESARDLVPRALEHSAEGYRLLSDPRLYGASALWLDKEKRAQIYAGLKVPVLAVLADQGLFSRHDVAQQMLEEAGAHVPDFRSVSLHGSHHFHMEADSADAVALRINQFLDTGQ